MTALNFKEIPDIINYAKKHERQIASITLMGLTPTLKQMYSSDIIIEGTKENLDYLDSMRDLVIKNHVNVNIFHLENQQTRNSSVAPDRLKRMIQQCDWVYTKFFIEADGAAKPCCFWGTSPELGNIKTSSFNEIWHGKNYNDLRQAILKGSTKYCSNCRREN
jgi:radical SAM protein with 4Fe4S-binding SPASM domain